MKDNNYRVVAAFMVFAFAMAALSVFSGCAVALREPAENHYVLTQTIADACRGQGGNLNYPEAPCSPDLQEDLDAMAAQAKCLLAGLRGEKCTLNEGEQ